MSKDILLLRDRTKTEVMPRRSLAPRRSHAARPVWVDHRDYAKAWDLGLHVDDASPIPLFMSVTTDRYGANLEVHVFSFLHSVSVCLDTFNVIRFIPRTE